MWFPSKLQWVVMWLTLILVAFAWLTDAIAEHAIGAAFLIAIGGTLIVWMLESKRHL